MIEDRAYQGEAVASVYRFMERGYGNPVVVAPTGAGKSYMIAMLMHDAITKWPGTRILCLADVKELIDIMGDRLIIDSTVGIPDESRPENILALKEAADEYGVL